MHRSFFAFRSAPALDKAPEGAQSALPPPACRGTAKQYARRGALRRLGSGAFALASCWLLSGCIDTYAAAPTPQTQAPPRPTNLARREGVSPSGATVAVASFLGGPDGIRDRFTRAFDAAARSQDIVIAAPAAANYLVRGYLNALPEGDDTAVTYVLDIFDSKKHRTQRVEDQITIKAKAADPWSVVDDQVLAAVAATSAAALATVLTNTPEAIAAATRAERTKAGGAPAIAARDGAGDDRTILAATPPGGPPGNTASANDLKRVALH